MDEIKLPRHVLDRIERRWAARFPQPMQHPQRATSPSRDESVSIAAGPAG